ncbi:MAG: hypothetical protein ACREM8_10230, partial [Vulcanimicrobiaceae bacterium]
FEAVLNVPYRHRQVFGFGHIKAGMGLAQMRNSLNAYEFGYGVGPGTLHVAGVFYGTAVPLGLDDAAWRKYRLAEASKRRADAVTDPRAVDRNPFANDDGVARTDDSTIAGLAKRGASFFMCNHALTGMATFLTVGDGLVPGSLDAVLADLRALLLPQVMLVPAGVAALNDAQEARYTYLAT